MSTKLYRTIKEIKRGCELKILGIKETEPGLKTASIFNVVDVARVVQTLSWFFRGVTYYRLLWYKCLALNKYLFLLAESLCITHVISSGWQGNAINSSHLIIYKNTQTKIHVTFKVDVFSRGISKHYISPSELQSRTLSPKRATTNQSATVLLQLTNKPTVCPKCAKDPISSDTRNKDFTGKRKPNDETLNLQLRAFEKVQTWKESWDR